LNCFREFAGINGFGDIAVHSGGQAAFAVSLHGVSGNSNDGNVRAGSQFPFADASGSLQAVHFRHLDVHQDDVEVVESIFFPEFQGFNAVVRRSDRVPLFLEEFLRQDAIHRIVFGKKDVELTRRFFRECADNQGNVLMRGMWEGHRRRQQ